MYQLLSKIGKLLFHRMGIMMVLIAAQIALYVAGLLLLQDSQYYGVYWGIALTLSVLAVVWIVGSSSNPGYKIGWIIIVLALIPFGCVAYLLLGGNHLSYFNQRRLRIMERRMEQQLGRECARSGSFALIEGEDAGRMAHYLEQVVHCPVYGNTETRYYPLGDVCYDDILDALRGARRYIFIEYFIIEEGKLWNSVLEILKEKAAAGVEIRVIYDDIGSIFTLPANYPAQLEKLGIHCRVFNRLVPVVSLRQNNRDHRKLCIIDGKVGFTGGMNLADEYINRRVRFGHWKDSAILLRGEAVWSMTVMFLSMWDYCSGWEEDFDLFRPESMPRLPGSGWVQPYTDTPLDHEKVGQAVYLNMISRARDYIYITTPYLIVDVATNTALCNAAKAGVDVRIITPHIPDKKTVFEVTRAYYPQLLEAGVRIFEYTPGFIHGKNFVVDDRYATVGTVNLDYRSMFLHFENGVLLYDTPTVSEIYQDFLETQGKSLEITLADCRKVPLPRRLLRDALRLFAPLL